MLTREVPRLIDGDSCFGKRCFHCGIGAPREILGSAGKNRASLSGSDISDAAEEAFEVGRERERGRKKREREKERGREREREREGERARFLLSILSSCFSNLKSLACYEDVDEEEEEVAGPYVVALGNFCGIIVLNPSLVLKLELREGEKKKAEMRKKGRRKGEREREKKSNFFFLLLSFPSSFAFQRNKFFFWPHNCTFRRPTTFFGGVLLVPLTLLGTSPS